MSLFIIRLGVYNNSFYYYTALVEVVLHDGLRSIGANAFSGCKSLVHIVIPATVTSIGDKAFCECKGLEKLYLKMAFFKGLEVLHLVVAALCLTSKFHHP